MSSLPVPGLPGDTVSWRIIHQLRQHRVREEPSCRASNSALPSTSGTAKTFDMVACCRSAYCILHQLSHHAHAIIQAHACRLTRPRAQHHRITQATNRKPSSRFHLANHHALHAPASPRSRWKQAAGYMHSQPLKKHNQTIRSMSSMLPKQYTPSQTSKRNCQRCPNSCSCHACAYPRLRPLTLPGCANSQPLLCTSSRSRTHACSRGIASS